MLMTLKELRSTLQGILEAEEATEVDWLRVDRLCNRTLGALKRQPAPDYTDDFVYVYLEDPQLRRKDPDDSRIQHQRLRNWLLGSEMISR